jgi:hypothetical protein
MNRISEAELKAMEALHSEADCECCVVHRRLLSALRESYAEIDRMREWMREHARHTTDCHYGMELASQAGREIVCTCGLSALLEDDTAKGADEKEKP